MTLGNKYTNRDTGRNVRIVKCDNVSVDFIYEDDREGRVYWALLRYFDDFWRPSNDPTIQSVVDDLCVCCRPKVLRALGVRENVPAAIV